MFIQDTLRQFVSHTHHSRRTWLATHSPATRTYNVVRVPTADAATPLAHAQCVRPQAAHAPLCVSRTEAARCPSSSPTCRPSQMLSLRAHYRVQVRTVVFSGSPALGEWPPAASLRSRCDLDRLLVARARPSLAHRPRGAHRVTLRPPSRRPSPRRAQAAAPARLTCAASRRRWRRCPAASCP